MELACILERRGTRAQEKYPAIRVARTLDELLADKQIQLCVIATPNDSHFDLAKACLLAGRDVVVDKPFAPTLAESTELVRLAAERGRLITVYQDRRWDGDFATIKKIAHSGDLGTIVEYECRFDRFRLEPKPNAWREKADQPAAGVLFDLGPHVIDQALVLFGEPKSITRRGPGAHHCVCAGAAFFDSWDQGIVCEVWNGSAGGAAAGRSISSRHRLGSGLG
jgi:predicted dehydrogenase